ncbi:hypothetical protein GOODEAATRI_015884, partial [Goodea atripinnis]
VVFGGDPEAALIQYTKNEEARRAISSTEAVLNNRFIRVYWHREPSTNSLGQEQTSGSQGAGSAPGQGLQHSNMHKVLINRLEKNRAMKPEERANIMKTLKELTEKITQLQNEMNPTPQAKRLGLIPPMGRGRGRGKMTPDPCSMHAGRGRSRSREMMARGGVVNRMVVDHRPRTLAILGVMQEEKEELMPHFVV